MMHCNPCASVFSKRSDSRIRSREGIRDRHYVLAAALLCVAFAALGCEAEVAEPPPQPSRRLDPVPFTAVRIDDGFWSPRLDANRTITIPESFRRSDETGRISNFARAGGLEDGEHQGMRYDDSDVFKIPRGGLIRLGPISRPRAG